MQRLRESHPGVKKKPNRWFNQYACLPGGAEGRTQVRQRVEPRFPSPSTGALSVGGPHGISAALSELKLCPPPPHWLTR